jgi:hypothetical protein
MGTEMWRTVAGFDVYAVSNLGRVKNIKTGRILKCHRDRSYRGPYEFVVLSVDGVRHTKRVHGLVATAFLGPCPEGMEINHKDGVKYHNWSGNLEYGTHQHNKDHARATGLEPRGVDRYNAKLNPAKVRKLRRLNAQGIGRYRLAKRFGVTPGAIQSVLRGLSWGWV